jgi:hypothetical protein
MKHSRYQNKDYAYGWRVHINLFVSHLQHLQKPPSSWDIVSVQTYWEEFVQNCLNGIGPKNGPPYF